MPLSLRDIIWIRADERLEKEQKLELKKAELKIERERISAIFTLLSDLRHIQLSKMYFKTDASFQDFLSTLPSHKKDGPNEKQERRWKVKKRKPGEIPEWKKKLLAEQTTPEVE